MPIPNTLQVLCQAVLRELEGISWLIAAFPDAHRHMLRPVFVTRYLTVTGSSGRMSEVLLGFAAKKLGPSLP